MNFLVVSCAILGLLLIYFEFFLPGAVMGIIGALLLVLSLFLFIFFQHPNVLSLFFFIFALLLSVVLTIRLALITVKRRRDKNSFYSEKNQEGFIASIHQKELYGKTGVAATDLRPSGYIKIEKEFFQAVSRAGYIKKDEKVQVEGGEGARLIVKKI